MVRQPQVIVGSEVEVFPPIDVNTDGINRLNHLPLTQVVRRSPLCQMAADQLLDRRGFHVGQGIRRSLPTGAASASAGSIIVVLVVHLVGAFGNADLATTDLA